MIPRSASRSLLFAAVVAAAVAGCTGMASTTAPASTPIPLPSSAESPAAASASALAPARVSTPDEAVARVVAGEPRFAGIRPFDSQLIGQPSWYTVEPALGVTAFVVTFRIGSGDCQAGCIDEHIWVYRVALDGTVTLASESGDPAPTEAPPR